MDRKENLVSQVLKERRAEKVEREIQGREGREDSVMEEMGHRDRRDHPGIQGYRGIQD